LTALFTQITTFTEGHTVKPDIIVKQSDISDNYQSSQKLYITTTFLDISSNKPDDNSIAAQETDQVTSYQQQIDQSTVARHMSQDTTAHQINQVTTVQEIDKTTTGQKIQQSTLLLLFENVVNQTGVQPNDDGVDNIRQQTGVQPNDDVDNISQQTGLQTNDNDVDNISQINLTTNDFISAKSGFTYDYITKIEITSVINYTQLGANQSTLRLYQQYNSINIIYQLLKIIELFDK
jgi:hypothetical protein